jgi:hypothetical protein
MASCELLSFLDVYSRYHQINMNLEDEEKTSFVMPFRVYYYANDAIQCKNNGATYHNGVHIVLKPQIRRNVEGYIDDIIVKSKQCGELLEDLK